MIAPTKSAPGASPRPDPRPARPMTDPIPTGPGLTADLSGDEGELMQAMEAYKQRSGRMFPTWSEVLEILVELGYRKADPS